MHQAIPILSATALPVFCAAWFAYFSSKAWRGRTRDGIWAVIGGFSAVALALGLFSVGYRFGTSTDWEMLSNADAVSSGLICLFIGAVEEFAKILPVVALCLARRGSVRPREAMALAALSGVGFSAAESSVLMWMGQVSTQEALARVAAAPVTHALFAAPWGLAVGAFFARGKKMPLVYGALLSIATHATYNWSVISAAVPNFIALMVVASLWAWLLWRTEVYRARPARLSVGLPLARTLTNP